MLEERATQANPDSPEVLTWFCDQLAVKSQRQLARELGIASSVVSRNTGQMRRGEPLAKPFRKRLEGILEGESLKKLHRQHLKEQEAREEADRIAKANNERIQAEQREAKCRANEEAALVKAERLRQKTLLENAVMDALDSWQEKLQDSGWLAEGEEVEGDADALLEAGISDLDYVDIGVAAVALLPDHYEVYRGVTAGEYRKDVTWRQRLQKTAVPAGQTRSFYIGIFPASHVYLERMPDERWRHAKAEAGLIDEWRSLTDIYGHLATGKLPLFVSPETAGAFERLIDIEETSILEFVDSRLGPDARDRLKALRRRAVIPAVKREADGLLGDAASWYSKRGWKFPIQLIFVALLAPGVVGVAYGIMEIFRLLGVGRNAARSWLVENGLWSVDGAICAVIFIILIIILIIVAVCWVWRREGESKWPPMRRFSAVVLVLVAAVAIVTGIVMGVNAVHEIIVASGGLSQTIYIP